MEWTKIENVVSQPTPAVPEPEPVRPPADVADHLAPAEEYSTPEDQADEADQYTVPLDPEETADTIIELYDLGQNILFPKLYEKVLFSPADKATLRAVNQKIADNGIIKGAEQEPVKIEFKPAELKQLRKAQELEDYTNEVVPLTDKEKDSLKKPLTKLLNVTSVSLTPGKALLIAIVVISISRVIPLLGAKKQRGK